MRFSSRREITASVKPPKIKFRFKNNNNTGTELLADIEGEITCRSMASPEEKLANSFGLKCCGDLFDISWGFANQLTKIQCNSYLGLPSHSSLRESCSFNGSFRRLSNYRVRGGQR